MGLFDKFRKASKVSVADASTFAAAFIYEISTNGAALVTDFLGSEKKLSEVKSQKLYWQTAVEFQYLLLHVLDRIAFQNLSQEARAVLIEMTAQKTYQVTIESAQNSTPSAKKPLKGVPVQYFDRLNARNVQYAGYQEVFARGTESPKETLMWEFGKVISQTAIGYDNIFLVEASIRLVYESLQAAKLGELVERIG